MSANRRDVMSGLAAVGAATAFGRVADASPARPYRVGVIGSGWFGKLNLFTLMQVAPVEAVALCDIDRAMLEDATAQTMARPDSVVPPTRPPKLYADYRRMLAENPFDIVIVGTPDHWHALPALAVLKAGANVYLEKPVTVDVIEGRALVTAARAAKRTVQVGTQRRACKFLIEARERVVRAGLLGKVAHVDIYGFFHQRPPHFPPPAPAPAFWDVYCGPAPVVTYNSAIHPRTWRAFMEFGNGYMGDIGVHFIDCCRFLLDLRWPRTVNSSGGIYIDKQSAATVPDTQIAQFQYDDLEMTWTNRQWGQGTDPQTPWGARLYGDKGTLRITPTGYDFTPADAGAPTLRAELGPELAEFPSDKALSNVDGPLFAITRENMRDFDRALRTGTRPASDIEEGYISTSICILANMSMKLGRPLHWDGEAVIGDAEANTLLARPYRAPWEHPV
ncbi:MAG TPA: Gfo/Idh/MocA family oxidoreductase [Rhizomicrobium sp.]